MSPLSQLCHCIELDEEQVNFNVFIYNIVYHNLNKNKIEEVEIKVPEIKVIIKNEIIKKEEVKSEVKKEVKKEVVKPEVKPEIKSEVKKGPKTPAERQRERRERLKNQLGEEEFKKQNQKKMKEYRAKQQKEEKNDDSEDVDDDNVSTTSSTNNNKILSDDNKIACECGICYHKSYKSRHLNSKAHLEGLEKMQTKKVEVKKMKEDEKLENNKYKLAIKFVNSITDFDCRDNILGNENNEELYEELETYINRFINKKCNENQLNYDCYATIKEFIVNNDIKYEYDFFSEYLQNDPYDEDSESE